MHECVAACRNTRHCSLAQADVKDGHARSVHGDKSCLRGDGRSGSVLADRYARTSDVKPIIKIDRQRAFCAGVYEAAPRSNGAALDRSASRAAVPPWHAPTLPDTPDISGVSTSRRPADASAAACPNRSGRGMPSSGPGRVVKAAPPSRGSQSARVEGAPVTRGGAAGINRSSADSKGAENDESYWDGEESAAGVTRNRREGGYRRRKRSSHYRRHEARSPTARSFRSPALRRASSFYTPARRRCIGGSSCSLSRQHKSHRSGHVLGRERSRLRPVTSNVRDRADTKARYLTNRVRLVFAHEDEPGCRVMKEQCAIGSISVILQEIRTAPEGRYPEADFATDRRSVRDRRPGFVDEFAAA